MKTLQDLKEQYAKSIGEESWYEFKQNYHKGEIEIAMDKIFEGKIHSEIYVTAVAKAYIKPIRHTLHLGEEEGFLNDLILFGKHLISVYEKENT